MSTALMSRKESLFDKIFIDGVTNSLLALTLVLKSKPRRKKKSIDMFTEELTWKFPPSALNNSYYRLNNLLSDRKATLHYQVIEYTPAAFERIRRLDAVTRDQLLSSIDPEKNGSFIHENS